MTDSVSRYYESMGRGKGAPYIDEKLNYAQTEPDLTEAVNKNIDEQIKDSQQFFADNIKMFNDSIKVRDQAFKDLVSLTKDGIKMVKQYNKFKDNRNYLQNIDNKANDGVYMTKWTTAEVDFKKEAAKIDKDFNIEIAIAEDKISKTGSYTFEGPDGTVTIDKDNLGSWKSALLQSKGLTGSNAAKEANILAPAFWEIAKRDLLHSRTGLRFDELTDPDDKREWLEEAAAHFLGYVRDSNPRISDGDIINHILPNLKSTISQELGVDGLVQNSAANQEVSNNTLYGRATTIKGVVDRGKNGNLSFDEVFDSKTGMIKSIAAAYEAKGYTPKDAMKEALSDYNAAVVFAYQNLGMTEEDYYYLKNEHKFLHADGHEVVFADMGPLWTQAQVDLDRQLNEVNRKRDTIALNGRFNELKERYEDHGTLISTEEQQEFVGTNLFEQVSKFKQLTDVTAKTGTDSDKDTVAKITNDVELYAGNTFPKNITTQTLERNKNYIKIAANQDYFRLVKELEEGNVDSAKARADAYIIVQEKIKKGEYNEHVPKDEVEYDPGKILIKNTRDIKANKNEWLNYDNYHIGELKYVVQGLDYLKFGGDIPILYVNLAKEFPDLDARGLLVARLKSMKHIGNEYDAYLTPLSGKIDSFAARNLTHHPSDAKTYQTILQKTKNFTGITEALLEREISKNIIANGGENAIFTRSQVGVEGGYENANLSEMNVGDIYRNMLAGNSNEILDDKLYGIYGIRGDNLKLLLEYMLDNNMPIADRNFDRRFQDELMMLNLALEAQKKLVLNGDVSYLSMLPITEDESKNYEKLFKGIENVDELDEGIWNEVRVLTKAAVNYKINMDLYGPDKKEEE